MSTCIVNNFLTKLRYCNVNVVQCWLIRFGYQYRIKRDTITVMLHESGKKLWFPSSQVKEVLQIHPFRSDLSFVPLSYFIDIALSLHFSFHICTMYSMFFKNSTLGNYLKILGLMDVMSCHRISWGFWKGMGQFYLKKFWRCFVYLYINLIIRLLHTDRD